MGIEVYGIQQVMARLNDIKKNLDPNIVAELKEFAETIRDLAKIYVPIDTGSLRTSIRLQTYASTKAHIHRIGVSAGGYVTNPKTKRKVDYASYVEFGTSGQRGQPYMRPAFDMCKRSILKLIKESLKK